MDQVFEMFAELLSERLRNRVIRDENSVKDTFCDALLSTNFCQSKDVVSESPHPTIVGARVDRVVHAGSSKGNIALEFKYHRGIPSAHNQPRPENAGKCFDDMFRLARRASTGTRLKYFVYLTDGEMAKYYRNPNGFASWFELPLGQVFQITTGFVARRAQVFRQQVRDNQIECSVVCCLSRELPSSNSLRVYRVEA